MKLGTDLLWPSISRRSPNFIRSPACVSAPRAAGIRKPDRRDLVVIECAPGTAAAAVFTQQPLLRRAGDGLRAEHLGQSAPHARW
ncbi:MAG: hypothetical protein MZV65_34400 [Chromatiales bacterium]|nr:hypothetical protein [Chromatiales bacterium]